MKIVILATWDYVMKIVIIMRFIVD